MQILVARAPQLAILIVVGITGVQFLGRPVFAEEEPRGPAFSAAQFRTSRWHDARATKPDFRLPAESIFQGELLPITQAFYSPIETDEPSIPPAPTPLDPPLPPLEPNDSDSPVLAPSATFASPMELPRILTTFHANKVDYLTSTDDTAWYVGGLGRAYYLDDQRYQFTGCEQSFGVQGVVEGGVRHVEGDWVLNFESQFFLNQPYDQNILGGTPFLDSFQTNFHVDPFQISLMSISARKENFFAQLGRIVTPFGRFYYPIYSNNFWDSPFIRSDAILYRETGALVQWDPAPFIVTAAITNGGFEQDTNSSKALISRIGLYGDSYAVGSSIKVQDGISSEWQKQCNSHIGVDAMYRWKQWTLSGEAIIDYYGMNRPGLDPDTITWGRSLYFRDADQTAGHPLVGYGYYVNLERAGERWQLNFNYGDYLPQKIGDVRQDTAIHRAMIKATRHVSRHLDAYSVTMLENIFQSPVEITPGHYRTGFGLLVGLQYTL